MIEVRDIRASRGGAPVLERASFSVPDGAFASVLGPSGAGKSTLLSVMAGLLPQDAGEVLVDGESIDRLPPERRSVSMVFQDSRLFPNMDVLANVAFPLRMRGVAKAERERRAAALLAEVRLDGLEGRSPRELSGGQRQRVALARALAGSPAAVLLDEPFSGLDESLRDDMRRLVLELQAQRGVPMVMVTHDAVEALVMSDLVVYIDHGAQLACGTPAQVLLAPDAPAAAGFSATTAVEGEVAGSVFRAGRLCLPATVPDGPAVLLRLHDGSVTVRGTGEAS